MVIMAERYKGVVEHVHGDQVVVYDVNGDVVEQTYERSQFIDSRVPPVGTRVVVKVKISAKPNSSRSTKGRE